MSSRTLGFLGDQFEVEPAHGEKREQVLRTAGIETYFILRARYPVINTFFARLSRRLIMYLLPRTFLAHTQYLLPLFPPSLRRGSNIFLSSIESCAIFSSRQQT